MRYFIVVFGIGMSVKICNKKIFCFFQIIYIQSDMLNFHFSLHIFRIDGLHLPIIITALSVHYI